MAIVNMTDAVSGQVASSTEYNKLIDNIQDLDARLGPVVSTSTAAARLGSLESRATTLEGRKQAGAYYGEWTDDNAGGTGTQTIDNTTGTGEKVTVYTNQVVTPVGMSISGGTVTVTNAGLYLVNASIQLATNNGTLIAMWIAKGNGASSAGSKYGPTSGYRSDVLSASGVVRLAAGGTVSVYAAVWQSTPAIDIWKANGNNVSVAYLGP